MKHNQHQKPLPTWVLIWLVLSSLIVLWDVFFVLLRPATFPGGSLARFWIPYAQYIKIDTSYADMHNDFVVAQSIMSLFEIGIALFAILLHYLRQQAALLFAFSALLLTGSKTILIFVLEIVGGYKHVIQDSTVDLVLLYVLPNSIWIIVPLIAAFILGRKLIKLACPIAI